MRGGFFESLFEDLDFRNPGETAYVPVDVIEDFLFEVVDGGMVSVFQPYQGHQPSSALDDKGFFDFGYSVDYAFDFFGIDVFSRRAEDYAVEPSLDGKPAFGVHACKVVGPEPAVGREHGCRPFRVFVIAEHYILTLAYDFTYPRIRVGVM